MNAKKLAAPIIAIMMIAAIFVTMAAAFTAPNANDARVEFVYNESYCDGLYVNEIRDYQCTDCVEKSALRIYGEDSIGAAFPYTYAEAPFDISSPSPEAPGKDYVVFNPAYIDHTKDYDCYGNIYNYHMSVDGADANEKVFAKQWYVPEYPEPRGEVWIDVDPVCSADIVTEYSYMLLDTDDEPIAGHAGSTAFWFPIGSSGSDCAGDQIGLDSFDITRDAPWLVRNSDTTLMVQLDDVNDYNGDDLKDITIGTSSVGLIDLTLLGSPWIEFLDHRVYLDDILTDNDGVYALVDIYYLGADRSTESLVESNVKLYMGEGYRAAFGRHYNSDHGLCFERPWYVQADGFSTQLVDGTSHQVVYLTIGRRLHMGETFFVDGAEYDISMIYGPESSGPDEFTTFKYITIRNPTPKLEDVTIEPLTVTKTHVDICDVLPMLPPFNMPHDVVDDINIPFFCPPCVDCDEMNPDDCDILEDYDTVEERVVEVDPLEIHWMSEDVEPRFLTNLCEIFDEDVDTSCSTCNLWQWTYIHLMPDQYTEMCYPEMDDIDDGGYGDFLMVSSWEAPNSCGNRVKFAYDANDATDIYVNELEDGNNSVRIYGEDSIDAAFPYNDPEGPFNKLSDDAPRKDFVTFNPAYYGAGAGVTVSGDLGREKVFVRQWYVPDYPEPKGEVWDNSVYTPMTQPTIYSPDIVTEYSYMLLDENNNPAAGTAGDTVFRLPTGSSNPQIGLNNYMLLRGKQSTMVRLREVGDFNGDGKKDMNVMSSERLALSGLVEGDRIMFLDHEIKVVAIGAQEIIINVYYLGNNKPPEPVAANINLDVCGDKVAAGRELDNYAVGAGPIFLQPWYVEVVCDEDDYYIVVGRLLHMGETFFVDGAEYDVAMIYGPNADDFMYLTLRNPIPKHYDVSLNILDIKKEHVDERDILPMLPPFNGGHAIVDDINIPTDGCTDVYGDTLAPEENSCIHWRYDEVNERIVWGQPKFECFFVEEDIEPRFTTNLLEILDEEPIETWQWLHIITRPDHYTTMVYPDVGDVPNRGDVVVVDGDFLITTSGPIGGEPDCNPWDDDGIIEVSEIMEAITLWTNQEPPAPDCSSVSVSDIMGLITTWTTQ